MGKYDGILSLQQAGILTSIGPHFWLRYGLEVEKNAETFAYLFPPYQIASGIRYIILPIMRLLLDTKNH